MTMTKITNPKLKALIERNKKLKARPTLKKEAKSKGSQMKKRHDECRTRRAKESFISKVMFLRHGGHFTRVPDAQDDSLGNQNGNVLMMLQSRR